MTQQTFSYVHPATHRRLTLQLHDDNELLSTSLLRVRTYEPGTSSAIAEILTPGDVMIDVGANIGWHTLLAAEVVGRDGHVYAYEPDPRNYAILTANCRTNGLAWVSAINAACGDRNATELLHLSATNYGDHRLYNVASEARATCSVRLIRLDDEFATEARSPALIKIDTQGYEPKILRGMAQLVAQCRPAIVMEFWPHGVAAAGESIFDILAFIERFDYTPHIISPVGMELTTPGVLLELSRTLLRPESEKHIEIALLQTDQRARLRKAAA